MSSRFAIAKIDIDQNNMVPERPWIILEHYKCFDGVRIRLVQDSFATKEDALNRLVHYWDCIEETAKLNFVNSVTGINHEPKR